MYLTHETHQYAIALTQFEIEDYEGIVETLRPKSGSGHR